MTGSCRYSFDPTVVESSSLADTWDCPHDAHPGAERCLFHLDPGDREGLGIDEAVVTERFRDLVTAGGQTTKRFVGASLGTLDLSYLVVTSPDRHPIDLRHADVDTLAFTETDVTAPLDLRDATIGEVDWRETTFTRRCDLSGATITDDVVAEACVFEGDVDAVGVTFGSTIRFDEARFRGDACFRETEYRGPASFRGVEFHGDANLLDDDACFEDAHFADDVTFTNAGFRYADFVGAHVAGDLDLSECAFTGDAEFRETMVAGDLDLRGVEFHGGANVLVEDADFTDITVHGDTDATAGSFRSANFSGAAFDGGARFTDTAFERDATFDDVAFHEIAVFDEARFHGDTSFVDTEFGARASFRGTEFRGDDNVSDDDLTMTGATFGGPADFERARFRFADFSDVTFAADADFPESTFDGDATFDRASFEADVDASEARFHDDASFAHAHFAASATFDGAEFQGGANTRDDDLSFRDATFAGDASFDVCRFRLAVFEDATFGDRTSFIDTEWDGNASFSDATFEHDVRFDEARFRDDAAFDSARFDENASFQGAEFHGGANILDEDVNFSDARFDENASFRRAEFGYADFKHVQVHGDASFPETTFTDSVHFDGARIAGHADFDEAVFEERASFQDAGFDGFAEFDESRFDSNVSFANATFDAVASFQGAGLTGSETVLEDDADFEGATFADAADFSKAEFRYANFSTCEFADDVGLDYAFFEAGATFEDATIAGTLSVRLAQFEGTTAFDALTVEGDATFDDSQFVGGAKVNGDEVTFADATFLGHTTFARAEFTHASLTGTRFAEPVNFREATFDRALEFEIAPEDEELVVDLGNATLNAGTITQPGSGAVFYDMTQATVRNVELVGSGGRYELFDYFRFCDTDFDGFDFSNHMDELSRNNWLIHRFALDPADLPADDLDSLDDPARLESTYLKAKTSADAFGHRKAAAEFFIKELTYRRKKNWNHALSPETPMSDRARAAGKWFGNKVLHETCGYGERLWRVIYISVLVVFSWAFMYTFFTQGTKGASGLTTAGLTSPLQLFTPAGFVAFGKNLYFSIVTFTTLGYGDVQPVGTVARTLAGLESFIGALLVALVVFVLGRRVAW